MRLFIAINFDSDIKEKLLSIQNSIRSCAVRGNFSREENLHLTLVFLGEISPKKVAKIETEMEKLSASPFEIVFKNIGSFKRDNGDIWWVGIEESQKLLVVQKSLSDGLSAAGFEIEKRKFTPHLTLAREVTLKEKSCVEPLPARFGTSVNKISLMKSERINGKLVYSEIYEKKL